jgi:hypothetical protein
MFNRIYTAFRDNLADCPETSVWNDHSALYNASEDRMSHLHRGGNLKSRSLKSEGIIF